MLSFLFPSPRISLLSHCSYLIILLLSATLQLNVQLYVLSLSPLTAESQWSLLSAQYRFLLFSFPSFKRLSLPRSYEYKECFLCLRFVIFATFTAFLPSIIGLAEFSSPRQVDDNKTNTRQHYVSF